MAEQKSEGTEWYDALHDKRSAYKEVPGSHEYDKRRWGYQDPWMAEHRPKFLEWCEEVGAIPLGFNKACIREAGSGAQYWSEIAHFTMDFEGTRLVIEGMMPENIRPDEGWASILVKELMDHPTPEWKHPDASLLMFCPALEKQEERESECWTFWDERGKKVLMIQERIILKFENGHEKKKHLPWTYWSDGEWRCVEPPDKLPLYGLEQLRDKNMVCVHEGPRGAQVCNELLQYRPDHQYRTELELMGHVGWVGGARNPHRTDWSPLERMKDLKRVVLVADNDMAGYESLPRVSQHIPVMTEWFQFPSSCEQSCDMADELPPNLPSFQECLSPGTWATEEFIDDKGKITHSVRPLFAREWVYCEKLMTFGHVVHRGIQLNRQQMELFMQKFSNTTRDMTKELVKKSPHHVVAMTYQPGHLQSIVLNPFGRQFNMWTPSTIVPTQESIQPFLEFLEFLCPVEHDRFELMRWIASVMARPDHRVLYAMVLISTSEGTGKGILTDKVLMPIVGEQNTIHVSQEHIASQWNDWAINNHLIICNEFYQGGSWKVSNKLKNLITDRDIGVNAKNLRIYRDFLSCQIVCCSNDVHAVNIDNHDRRWLIPRITNRVKTWREWDPFVSWLQERKNLGAILSWAKSFTSEHPINSGERAPMTDLKLEVIEESEDLIGVRLRELLHYLAESQHHTDLWIRDVFLYFQERPFVYGKFTPKQSKLKDMIQHIIEKEELPLTFAEGRPRHRGQKTYLLHTAHKPDADHPCKQKGLDSTKLIETALEPIGAGNTG